MARSFVQDAWMQQSPATSEWTGGPQSVPHPLGEQLTGIGGFAASLAVLHGVGKAKFGNVTGYDMYLRGIRAVEEYSPGRILRTFQLSHLLSPLESLERAITFGAKAAWRVATHASQMR